MAEYKLIPYYHGNKKFKKVSVISGINIMAILIVVLTTDKIINLSSDKENQLTVFLAFWVFVVVIYFVISLKKCQSVASINNKEIIFEQRYKGIFESRISYPKEQVKNFVVKLDSYKGWYSKEIFMNLIDGKTERIIFLGNQTEQFLEEIKQEGYVLLDEVGKTDEELKKMSYKFKTKKIIFAFIVVFIIIVITSIIKNFFNW